MVTYFMYELAAKENIDRSVLEGALDEENEAKINIHAHRSNFTTNRDVAAHGKVPPEGRCQKVTRGAATSRASEECELSSVRIPSVTISICA